MFAIHALYHGRSRRRADYIRDVAEALAATSAVSDVRLYGAEGFAVVSPDADGATTVVLNLLQAGDFAVGVGAIIGGADAGLTDPGAAGGTGDFREQLFGAAARSFGRQHRPATVTTRVELPGPGGARAPGTPADVADDVTAAFTLLAHVLTRRTPEGREATALMRQGYLQTEAAEEVGISKQAMSQRLAAAGWQAEQAGWTLAVHMLRRVTELV
ncbi:DNA-binding protein [uncultured Corynebacterium sp.]|uniref:DNA-binding protein n=1 Tax=uncultured Corynebacterium sp. TaxID=159447 RepID=UPI0025E59621|nr:DNA-binding protein [uncultured Corynebacterium sp.]